LQPSVRRRWSKRGNRPIAETNRQYQWLWSFAAVEPETGESFFLTLPDLSGETAQIFLDEFVDAHLPEGKRAILLWDGAPAHRAKKLQIPERITIVQIPAYTPELNPSERLWTLLREVTANQAFKTLDELEEKVVERSRQLMTQQEAVSKLTNYHWLPSG
jgi:transposase